MAKTASKAKKKSKAPAPSDPKLEALRGVLIGLLVEHRDTHVESLGAFGRRAGISDTTVSDLISGNRAMGLEALLAVAEGLGQPLGDVQEAADLWANERRPASACFPKGALAKAAKLATASAEKVAAAKALAAGTT